MKNMKLTDQTAGALTWLAVLTLIPGSVIVSPSGRFFCYALAGIFAFVPLVFGAGKRRIFAGIITAISLLLVIATYPEFTKDQDNYRQRVGQKSLQPSSSAMAESPGVNR